ncbi:MAG TPA: hypothetical protein PLA90_16650 [Candidatus Sumerlaeota bacterium]|nr:hypothetical protein [Candidatus Sumerlaeota bacterium]
MGLSSFDMNLPDYLLTTFAVLVSLGIALVVYLIALSWIESRAAHIRQQDFFLKVGTHYQAGALYNFLVSRGRTIRNVKFVGVMPIPESSRCEQIEDQPHWVVVEKEDGEQINLLSESIECYEDA